VRSGKLVNLVAVVQGRQSGNPQSWSHEANRAELLQALGPVHSTLTGMLDAVPNWKLWPLNDRPPMTGPYEHGMGRMVLAGDAAHPMRPYLAQGAAMALEDAWTMGRLLSAAELPVDSDGTGAVTGTDWPQLLKRFGQARWKRNAWVQMRSARNGTIFHADGALRSARNLSMGLLRERLLDNPRLYSGPPEP
jgi:salicylate hydroxylase